MKKTLLLICFFTLLFLFINLKSNDTDSYVSLNYYDEDTIYNEKYFTLKLYDFNILNLKRLLNYNIVIISIIPEKNIYNINNITFDNHDITEIILTSISDYKNKLLNNNLLDEALYIENKGFNIDKIKILTTYKEIFNLEKKINFKILNT